MAKKGKDTGVAKPVTGRRRRQSTEQSAFIYLVVFVLVIIGVLSWQTAVFITVSLLPTFVLSLNGQGEKRILRMQTVGFANIAGTAPFAVKVYAAPNSYLFVLADPTSLAVIWGAACMGYLLLLLGPAVAALIIQALSQDKIKKLNTQREQIVEVWGFEVTKQEEPSKGGGTPDPDF